MKSHIINMKNNRINKFSIISKFSFFLILTLAMIVTTVSFALDNKKSIAKIGVSNNPILAMASTPGSDGYWLVANDGGVFTYGAAQFYGSTGSQRLNRPIVSIASTPTGRGYWLVASDGGVFTFGDAQFYGSTGSIRLNRPIVSMTSTPSGRGYWLAASDGGIFAFGDAQFYGSTGSIRLNKPIVAMTSTPSGRGYWLVASDGGIFAFGDAQFYGSTGSIRLNKPIVAMTKTVSGRGYTLVASDGGIFNFGDSQFYGATSGDCLGAPTVGINTATNDSGYYTITADSQFSNFGPGHSTSCPPPPQNGCTGNIVAKKIIVSINLQHLWACEFGTEYLNTPITTGAEGIGFGTPTGAFSIYAKQRNTYLVGPGYRSFVSYWMPFYRGYGLHDASWRRSFGVGGFERGGSHGCVNMPPSVTSYVYNWATIGTQVIVKR